MNNRAKKKTEKTDKYGPQRLELSRKYPGYKIPGKMYSYMCWADGPKIGRSYEIISIFGKAGKYVLEEEVPSTTLNRLFKILTA